MASDQSTVTYRDVPGFPGYRVGDDGSLWSCKIRGGNGRLSTAWMRLKSFPTNTQGYLAVSLSTDGKAVRRFVHHLVLEAFVGNCPEGRQGCHGDGRPENNALSNLRWDTPTANAADRDRHGKTRRHERHAMAKVNWSIVRAMRAEVPGHRQYGDIRRLAKKYGLSPSQAGRIIRGQSWRGSVAG